MSELALKLIAENKAKYARGEDARVLDLGSCGLNETLPEEIQELQWVEELNISNYTFKNDKYSFPFTHDTSLFNRFSKAPQNLSLLKNLKSLILLGEPEPEKERYINFTNLESIKNIQSLEELEVSQNIELSDLSPLSNLPVLKRLVLSRCSNLSDLSPLKSLSSLKILGCGGCRISDLTPIGSLPQLEELWLWKNQVLTIEPLRGLHKTLVTLNLSKNPIVNISILANFDKLEKLDLVSTQVADLSPILHLIKKGMSVEAIDDVEFRQKYYMAGFAEPQSWLRVKGAPLNSPPVAIVERGNEAILGYFASLEGIKEEEKVPINEIKILLVGEGMAGKTSLLKQIKGLEFKKEESQTHGIIIEKLRLDTLPLFQRHGHLVGVTGRFWDFGGQEIMHASHQFFLSNRSIYILVLDSRTDAKKEEWLKHIEKFGGNSPTILAINKIDENRNYDVERVTLNNKFPFIGNRFHKISCAQKEGLSDLAKELAGLIPETEIFKTKFSPAWVAVKEQLEQETAASNYINQQRFEAICAENKVHDSIQQKTLLNYLDSLGIALHFESLGLKNFYVLDPHWVTIGVYKIINSPSIEGGIFEESMLDHILNVENVKKTEYDPAKEKVVVYSDAEQHYLVKIMQKFELLFEYEEGKYLVPDLLPKEPTMDYTFDESGEEHIRFVFKYDFFPPTLMPRFIIRMKDDISEIARLWRSGVELHPKNKQVQGIVKADKSDRRIDICICGSTMDKREYFAFILKILGDIHGTYKIEPKGFMPVPGYPVELVEYEELRGLEAMDVDELPIGKLGKKFSVSKDFLDKISTKQQRMEEKNKQGDTYNFNISGGNIGNLGGKQGDVRQEVNQGVQARDPEAHEKLDRLQRTTTAIEASTYTIQSNQQHHTEQLTALLQFAEKEQTMLETIFAQIDALPETDSDALNRIDELLEEQFGKLLERLPGEHQIVAAWKKATQKAPDDVDMKWKLKFKLPLIFAEVEKELTWDGKKMLKSIREEITAYGKGERSFRELFWED